MCLKTLNGGGGMGFWWNDDSGVKVRKKIWRWVGAEVLSRSGPTFLEAGGQKYKMCP